MKKLQEREIEIELKAVDYAQSKSILLKKCSIPGERNWPDRIGLCQNNHTFFIEFKRPGEEARKSQLQNHRMLKRLGYQVYICDNIETAKEIIDKESQIACSKISTS